jgi:hypothetical protein
MIAVAGSAADRDVERSWSNNRLPEDLPLLITRKAAALSPEVRARLDTAPGMPTGFERFDV